MTDKLKKNLYYLSWITIFILSIFLIRLLKIYDICCTVLSIVAPIIFGFIFAWILRPIEEKIEKKYNKFIACGILIGIFTVIYVLIIGKLVPMLFKNLTSIFDLFKKYIDKLETIPFFSELQGKEIFNIDLLLSSCTSLISIIGVVGLIHIFGFYMLYNYEQIVKFLRGLIPKSYKKMVNDYIEKLSFNMRLYIKGTLIDTSILFLLSTVLYMIIGLDYPVILASFSAITNIIPFIGPYIGGAIAVLVAFKQSFKLVIATLIVIILAQTVESNIINPMIMSKCVKINPLIIVITLTIMGKLGGLLGMIFAVPLLIILKLTFEFLQKYRNKKENLDKAKQES